MDLLATPRWVLLALICMYVQDMFPLHEGIGCTLRNLLTGLIAHWLVVACHLCLVLIVIKYGYVGMLVCI
jgi:hypothetical protein